MDIIRDLYNDRDNSRTIPKCIYDELRKHSNRRSQCSQRGIDGKFKTTYGEMLLPIFARYTDNDLNFYLSPKDWAVLEMTLQKAKIIDKDYNDINRDDFYKFMKLYSDGFVKGYSECESLFQKDNSLFKASNESTAYNVYSRVFNYDKMGGFPFTIPLLNTPDDEKKIDALFKKHYPLEKDYDKLPLPFQINENECFQSGYDGGVFYKCWLIILDNPLLFEPLFLAKEKAEQQPETEPLDLSDSSAVEKIIYLNELGIIDFLRTKTKAGISNGGLASVLSGITGIKAETIKPSLNRLSNNDTDDKNHPYRTQKTVDKIKLFLSQLGF
jgi:hypothetical protein